MTDQQFNPHKYDDKDVGSMRDILSSITKKNAPAIQKYLEAARGQAEATAGFGRALLRDYCLEAVDNGVDAVVAIDLRKTNPAAAEKQVEELTGKVEVLHAALDPNTLKLWFFIRQ